MPRSLQASSRSTALLGATGRGFDDRPQPQQPGGLATSLDRKSESTQLIKRYFVHNLAYRIIIRQVIISDQ